MNNIDDFMKIEKPLNSGVNNNIQTNNMNNNSNNKKKIIISIVITVLVLGLITGAYILGTMNGETINNKESNEETSSTENMEISSQIIEEVSSQISQIMVEESGFEEEEITNTNILKYIEPSNVYALYKGKKYEKSVKDYRFVELLLFKDTNYIMTYCFMACNAEEGTYEFKNNELVLTQSKFYGSDACYFNEKRTSKNKMDGDDIIVNPQHGSSNITLKRTSLSNISDIIDRYEVNDYELEDCTE